MLVVIPDKWRQSSLGLREADWEVTLPQERIQFIWTRRCAKIEWGTPHPSMHGLLPPLPYIPLDPCKEVLVEDKNSQMQL